MGEGRNIPGDLCQQEYRGHFSKGTEGHFLAEVREQKQKLITSVLCLCSPWGRYQAAEKAQEEPSCANTCISQMLQARRVGKRETGLDFVTSLLEEAGVLCSEGYRVAPGRALYPRWDEGSLWAGVTVGLADEAWTPTD